MEISFTKMSGAGNDFVVVDNRSGIITNPNNFTIAVCDRRQGIGADGVLLVEKSNKADFLMQYYNADGSSAGMCGNGGRCIAKFAYDNGIITHEKITFEAFGHIYHASRIDKTTYELKMKDPIDFRPNQEIRLNGSVLKGNYLNTGTDHSIIFTEDNPEIGPLKMTDIINLGKAIRAHELYQPKGTNVNFVSKIGSNSIEVRTYERGVEDETLACGTGSVASALLSAVKYNMQSPVSVKVRSGKILEIGFERSEGNSFKNVTLKGPTENVFNSRIMMKNSFEITYS